MVVEGLTLTSPGDPYLTLRALAAYSGCSVRCLRDRLTDPHAPLPCYRLPGGKILVRRSDFDTWLSRYRQVGVPVIDQLVTAVIADLERSK